MENKYQEALRTLTDWFHSYTDNVGRVHERHITKEYEEAKSTIQELIDLYETESKYESFAEVHQDHQQEIAKLKKENKGLRDSCELKLATALTYKRKCEILEKALDIACERLKLSFIEKDKCEECGKCYDLAKCKDCWKEYLINESEKQ